MRDRCCKRLNDMEMEKSLLEANRLARGLVRASVAGLAALLAGCDSDGIGGPVTEDARTVANPIADEAPYVEPTTAASQQAEAWRATRPADAARMDRIAAAPQSVWLAGGPTDPMRVSEVAGAASVAGKLPVFVLYNAPYRDCSPTGGASSASAYAGWLGQVLDALAGIRAAFVLEPDALPGLGCLGEADAALRLELLRDAVAAIRDAGSVVYIDAGHPRWQTAGTMVDRLRLAGIDEADGFAVNVANTVGVAESDTWATAVAREVQRGYVIDTSRSGAGAQAQWCNPPDAALGTAPTTRTVGWRDALLWIKRPGESDGVCNGGPVAGAWWPEYALALVRAAE